MVWTTIHGRGYDFCDVDFFIIGELKVEDTHKRVIDVIELEKIHQGHTEL